MRFLSRFGALQAGKGITIAVARSCRAQTTPYVRSRWIEEGQKKITAGFGGSGRTAWLEGVLINFGCDHPGPKTICLGLAQLGFEIEAQESVEEVVG